MAEVKLSGFRSLATGCFGLNATQTMSALSPFIPPGGLKGSTRHFILEGRDGVDAMERGYVRGFDAVAKAELWERWRRGELLKAIGRAFGKPSSSIYFQVAPHGGIRPAPRRRSRLALTLSEREEILRGTAGARSMRSIARLLGRAPSTVSREIKRNGGYDRYRPAAADENAWRRGRRPKCCKLANNRWLRRTVVRKLELDWSPEQIAGWLKRAYPEDEHYQVSHETIYRSLYVQTRGVLKKELIRHLRSKRTMRRPRRAGDKRGQIVDLVSISKRPARDYQEFRARGRFSSLADEPFAEPRPEDQEMELCLTTAVRLGSASKRSAA